MLPPASPAIEDIARQSCVIFENQHFWKSSGSGAVSTSPLRNAATCLVLLGTLQGVGLCTSLYRRPGGHRDV
jgi:hypothetical protein